jgi:hypothetical protein
LIDQDVKNVTDKAGFSYTVYGLAGFAASIQPPYFYVSGVGSPLRVTDAGDLKCSVMLALEVRLP